MMKAHETRHHRAFLAMSALALGLAACGEQQPNDEIAQIPDPQQSAPRPQGTPATDAAVENLERAETILREKTAEARKAVDDATITAKVKSALITEPGLKSLAINVDTTAGVVTLRGTADNQMNRKKAEQLAATVEGVRNVKNELIVIPS